MVAHTPPASHESHDIPLAGCTSRPLVSYLKALGILRVLAEQRDPTVRARWTKQGYLELRTCLDRQQLAAFFLHEYRPTPLVSPWNRDAGFLVRVARGSVTVSADPARFGVFTQTGVAERFEGFKKAVACCCHVLKGLVERGLVTVDARGRAELSGTAQAAKSAFLTALRNELGEEVVELMDAVVVLTAEGFNFTASPIWSGGNDGRLEFSVLYVRLLVGTTGRGARAGLFEPITGLPRPGAEQALHVALYGRNAAALVHDTMGLFNPLGTGGPNAEPGFRNEQPMANAWDFVLAVEGAAFLAGAATRRYRVGSSRAAVPFRVDMTPAGQAALSDRELGKVRAEMWFPLWSGWASHAELRALFGEGRVQVGRRQAETGVDFVRALASLGVDRGFDRFERYAIMERNGQSYLAVPLGTYRPVFNPHTRLLDPLDGWIRRVDRAARNGTASLRAAWRRFLDRTFAWCQSSEGGSRAIAGAVLRSLGALEHAVVPRRASERPNERPQIRPLPPLEASRWLSQCKEDSAEYRIAVAFASLVARRRNERRIDSTRCHLEPIQWGGAGPNWAPDSTDCVWETGDLEDSLIAALQRRLFLLEHWETPQRQQPTNPWTAVAALDGEQAAEAARLEDIVRFIERSVEERELEEWIWGLALLDWPRRLGAWAMVAGQQQGGTVENVAAEPSERPDWDEVLESARPRSAPLPPLYALLRLCFSGGFLRDRAGRPIPVDPQLVRLAAAGRALEASRRAARRLHAAGYVPRIRQTVCSPDAARRIAAALVIPITLGGLAVLADFVLGEVPWRNVIAQAG